MSFINAFVPMVQMLTPLSNIWKTHHFFNFFKIIFLGVRVPGYPMDFPHPRCSSRLTKTRKGLFLGADGLSHFNAMDAHRISIVDQLQSIPHRLHVCYIW